MYIEFYVNIFAVYVFIALDIYILRVKVKIKPNITSK